ILIAISLAVFSSFVSAKEISMVCTWELFSGTEMTEEDTFIFNIDSKTVYWVNENQRIELDEVNEGRIVFTGIPKLIVVEKYKPLTFVLNRVTGTLHVSGEHEPYGFNNRCIEKPKIL